MNHELNAAKEKLEIVSGAAHFDFAQYRPPPFRIFAGGFFRKNAFGLIQEYCTRLYIRLDSLACPIRADVAQLVEQLHGKE